MNSPLSLAEWKRLEQLADAAYQAVSTLSHELIMAATATEDPQLREMFLRESERARKAQETLLPAYHWHPQPEWLGGNEFATREPHVMGMRRATILETK